MIYHIFFIIAVIMNNYKLFTTQKDEVSFQYPPYWLHEMENENTYLFFEEFLGSFRITPRVMDIANFEILAYLNKEFEFKQKYDPEWKTFNGRDFLCYDYDFENNGREFHVHYFLTGYGNILLTCSFAYDNSLADDMIGSIEITKELEGVETLLNSLKFKSEKKSKKASATKKH